MIYDYQYCKLDLKIDGKDPPLGVSINDFVLREFTLYAVPMLDVVFLDIANSFNYSDCMIKDGTKINVIMTFNQGEENEFTRTMNFRVCSYKPTIMVSNSSSSTNILYQVSCILDSNLLMRDRLFSFTGTVRDCLQNIFDNDIPDVNLITDFDDNVVHNFKKLKTESFARYLKQLVRAISNPNFSAYYAYYHDGENVYVLDLLAILKGNGDDDDYSSLLITEGLFIKMMPFVDAYTQAKKKGTYGCTVHQFDYDIGACKSKSSAQSYIANGQPTIDTKTKEDTTILMAGSMGNHTKEEIESYVNNIRNSGLFSYKCWFRFAFPTGVLGLQCVKVSYKDNDPVPFIVMGREIRLKNGNYTEDLLLYSNSMSQGVAMMFAGS